MRSLALNLPRTVDAFGFGISVYAPVKINRFTGAGLVNAQAAVQAVRR